MWAGADHHFRAVQLPLNLAMPEALLRANQIVQGKTLAMVQAARALGITLVTSAALLQGQLAKKLAGLCARGAWSEERRRKRAAICAVGAGDDHGAGGHEPGRARPRERRGDRRLEPAPRDQFLKLFQPK